MAGTRSEVRSNSERDVRLVDLALQGGGSHGAFTWGVLDRLLEEPWLNMDGISGTSAGAMNAAVLVDGHAEGGAEGARAALEASWRNVSQAALLSPFRRTPIDVMLGRWTLDTSPVFITLDLMSRMFSPYDLNPAGRQSTSRDTHANYKFRKARARANQIVRHRDQRAYRPRTRVSQCGHNARRPARVLPACRRSFKPVEINGESYWDGGYSGNPTITPLVRESRFPRIPILVQMIQSIVKLRVRRETFSTASTKSPSIRFS